MRFVGKRDTENLKHFVDAALQLHIVLHYRYEAVSDYVTVYLYAHGVLRGAQDFFIRRRCFGYLKNNSTCQRLR